MPAHFGGRVEIKCNTRGIDCFLQLKTNDPALFFFSFHNTEYNSLALCFLLIQIDYALHQGRGVLDASWLKKKMAFLDTAKN